MSRILNTLHYKTAKYVSTDLTSRTDIYLNVVNLFTLLTGKVRQTSQFEGTTRKQSSFLPLIIIWQMILSIVLFPFTQHSFQRGDIVIGFCFLFNMTIIIL